MAAIFQGGSDHFYQLMKGQEPNQVLTYTSSEAISLQPADSQDKYQPFSIDLGDHTLELYLCLGEDDISYVTFYSTKYENLWCIVPDFYGPNTYASFVDDQSPEPSDVPTRSIWLELYTQSSHLVKDYITDIWIYEWNDDMMYGFVQQHEGDGPQLDSEFTAFGQKRYLLHWTTTELTVTYYPPRHMCDTRLNKEKNENLVEILQGYVIDVGQREYNIYLDVINKSEYNITMTFNSSEANTHLIVWDGQWHQEEVPLTFIDGPWILYPGYNKILLIDSPYQTDLLEIVGVESAHMAFDLTSDYLIGDDSYIWQI